LVFATITKPPVRAEQAGTEMRLTIVAGVILGMSLAVQSAVGAHLRAKAGHVVSAVPVHQIAPWYVAHNGEHNAAKS
jgi:hypothetical protein